MSLWPLVPIKDFARVVGGATPKSDKADYWDGDIPWTTPRDLSDLDGKYLSDTPRKITASGLKSCSSELLPPNSVLFSSRAPIGHVAINTVPMATNQGFKSFVPSPQLDASFLFWWLKCHRAQLELLGNGATFKEVSKAIVERIEIPLPPLHEQRRIAAILDQADELRRKRQRAIDRLNQLGQAIFHEMFGDPHANDKKWPSLPVGEVTNCIVPGRDKPKSFSGDIPWITTAEIVHLGLTSSSNAKAALSLDEVSEVRARVIPANSVIMTCVGDLGKVSIAQGPMVINQQLHSFQCKPEISPYYLMYILSHRQNWMMQMATQTTLPYMNKTICNAVPILLPPIRLQAEFAERLSALIELRQTLVSARGSLQDFFASLQHRAFQGEL
jgi:type I restriction enzyme S subunit